MDNDPRHFRKQPSFAEFLQFHQTDLSSSKHLKSPSVDHVSSALKSATHLPTKAIKREDSEPSFRLIEPSDHQDRNFVTMSQKISMLINENQKLIEINSELMRELENSKANKVHVNQDSQQKILSYQQKLISLTQANEQLSGRLMEEQTKNKKEMELKINAVIAENENLNQMLQQRLNDLSALGQDLASKHKQIDLLNEEIKALHEKCQVLEQQKQVLLSQHSSAAESVTQLQYREQQLQQAIFDEQVKYQNIIHNLEQNYSIQIQELHNGFQKELNQQHKIITQQLQSYHQQQALHYQQTIRQMQIDFDELKTELNERAKIWLQEKNRLESLLKSPAAPAPASKSAPVKQCAPQQQTALPHANPNQSSNSHYTFRQNTLEDCSEQMQEPYLRMSTEQPTIKESYSYLTYHRPPLAYRNSKIPQLNTLTKQDYNLKYMGAREVTREPGNRSYSQYMQREEVKNGPQRYPYAKLP